MKKKKVRRSRSEWEALLGRQAESGQTVGSFCTGQGITASTFYYWRSNLKKKTAPRNGFVPVAPGPGRATGIVLRGRAGVEIEISGDVPMDKIRDLIAALSC